MTLDTVIMLFGAIVAVLPFLQLPIDWTNFFVFLAGVVIIGLGIAVRRRNSQGMVDQGKLFDAENKPE